MLLLPAGVCLHFQTVSYDSPRPSHITVLLLSPVSMTEVMNGQLKSYGLLLAYERLRYL